MGVVRRRWVFRWRGCRLSRRRRRSWGGAIRRWLTRRGWGRLRLWRRRWRLVRRSVWRLELELAMVTLIESLTGGATLEAALGEVQASLSDRTEEQAAKIVSHCFQNSVSSGLFSAIVL